MNFFILNLGDEIAVRKPRMLKDLSGTTPMSNPLRRCHVEELSHEVSESFRRRNVLRPLYLALLNVFKKLMPIV